MSLGSISDTILIAGGGIGGLAAAIGLARLGFRLDIFEQAEDFHEVGAGVQLGPNGTVALAALGLKAEVDRYAWQPDALVMRDAFNAEDIYRLPLRDGFLRRFGEAYRVIHRADLLELLLEQCRKSSSIALHTGSRVAGFEDHGDGVTLTLEDGRQAEGIALIGADGLHSVARQSIVGDGQPRPPQLVVYRGVIPRQELPDGLWSPDVIMWVGPGADFVQYPLRSGELFNLVATFLPEPGLDLTDLRGGRDELMRPYRDYRPEVQRLLELLTVERKWLVTDRAPVQNWARGRATLLGDAAHPMLQYMAQGACQAIEDAVQLTKEVERSRSDLASAFRAYSGARHERTARVQLGARRFVQVCQAGGRSALARARYFQRRTAEQAFDRMAWLYGPAATAPAAAGAEASRENHDDV
jgi:2-polyprenyl-6-methoxyphenol hydroxylase-like FAD-dependent oxidoreductase